MRYKRILLVAPRFYQGRFRLSIYPLAGLGYIAEALLSNGCIVNTFDMNLQYSDNDLHRKITQFKPDIIGFTAMTFSHRKLYALMQEIKESFPSVKIVVGGPHISTLREKVLEDCYAIDFGIILEGDITIRQLCNGQELTSIQGLIYRNNHVVTMNDFEKFITDLDAIPYPKYESFELEKYPTQQIGIVTSRGCPYSCIYCPVISAIGKHFRQRSTFSVVEEIEYWYRKGYREIFVLDDNFTLDRNRIEEICNVLIAKQLKGIHLKCPNGIRADRVDYHLLKKMKQAGFDLIAFGVEAADNKILDNIKKGEDIETVERSIDEACKLGFEVDLFFLIGSPGESLREVNASFALALRYPIRNVRFYNIIPFPNTELFDWIKSNNYFLHSHDYILNNASHFINEPCFFTPDMSSEDRKRAFQAGESITKRVRRNFIERKLKGPLLLRKSMSYFYTLPIIDDILANNVLFVKLKERVKNYILN